jgi:copper chaperone
METTKFKSNIKCDACVVKVTQTLNETVGEGKWQVDVKNPSKVVTIEGEADADKINEALSKVGYRVEEL